MHQYDPQPQSMENQQIYKVDDGIPSPLTRLRYRSAFSLFMRHCKIEDSDLSSLVQKHPRLIEAQIIGYIRFLADSWPDGLMKGQNEPRDEFGFKILNTFYDLDSGIVDT